MDVRMVSVSAFRSEVLKSVWMYNNYYNSGSYYNNYYNHNSCSNYNNYYNHNSSSYYNYDYFDYITANSMDNTK